MTIDLSSATGAKLGASGVFKLTTIVLVVVSSAITTDPGLRAVSTFECVPSESLTTPTLCNVYVLLFFR